MIYDFRFMISRPTELGEARSKIGAADFRFIFVIFIAAITLLSSFQFANAQESFSCSNPIVPCGRPGTPPCNLCYLYNLASNVVNYCLFCLILPVAAIALLLGGIFMLTSMGNPQRLQAGKTAITNTVIGVVIAFAAWLVIGTIVNTLGYTNKGFSGAWNTFPGCVAPIGPAPSVRQQCTYNPNVVQREACPTNPAMQRACLSSGYWSFCFETCLPSEINKSRSCQLGTCGGTQTCILDPAIDTHRWSDCKKTNPSCSEGKCPIQPAPGYCSIQNLQSSCFSAVVAEAAQICWQESRGDPTASGDSALSSDSPPVPISIGLFQINLACNTVGGFNCPTAFEGFNGNCQANRVNGKWKLKNNEASRTLYKNCVTAAKNYQTNITAACRIYAASGNSWRLWSTAKICGLN